MLVGSAPAAFAHGERAQEAFLRMRTVAWVNTTYSKTTVKQGETFTITGTAKILDAWPTNLAAGDPNTGYIGIIAPGRWCCSRSGPSTGSRPPAGSTSAAAASTSSA
jgi:methane/ammonia monooxygenase subunit B